MATLSASPTSDPALVDAVILAGRRRGEIDPLADIDGVAHKGLLVAGGKPLLRRVVDALGASGRIGAIAIAAPDDMRESFTRILDGAHGWRFIDAAGSPAETVLGVIDGATGDRPLLVTTCDHALLSAAIIGEFLVGAGDADAAAACVERSVYERRFPGSRRTFIRLRDLSFSGANLFLFRGGRAKGLAAFWRRLEQKRKKPLDMAREIGLVTAIAYFLGAMTKAALERTLKRKTGVSARLVPLSQAEAAIDVDKPQDLDLVRSILALD